jgi:hypothetical protein
MTPIAIRISKIYASTRVAGFHLVFLAAAVTDQAFPAKQQILFMALAITARLHDKDFQLRNVRRENQKTVLDAGFLKASIKAKCIAKKSWLEALEFESFQEAFRKSGAARRQGHRKVFMDFDHQSGFCRIK